MASPGKQAKLVADMIKDIDYCMFTTVGADGYLVSRPLSTTQVEFDGKRIWFFTSLDSPKCGEIRKQPKVNLAYASKSRNTYVSVSGKASLNQDRGLIEQFWNDALKAFFPKGKTDPRLTLIEVEVRTVEYWDGPSTLIGKAITFLIARVTKKEEVMGENRMVTLAPRKAAAKKAAAKKPPATKAKAAKAGKTTKPTKATRSKKTAVRKAVK